jgi:hypothetical protein
LEALVAAIQKKNLLPFHPIIVDKDMRIIEGQHRLKAAEKLNIPIYYIINESSDDADIILLNTTRRNWKIENYCNFYIESGNKNYKQAKEYSELYNVPLNILINIGIASRMGGLGYAKFKQGLYTFPQGAEFDKMIKILEHKTTIVEELSACALPFDVKRLVRSDAFARALLTFLAREDVLANVFLQKLKVKAESIKVCATLHAYHIMFREIYNWKNQNPID